MITGASDGIAAAWFDTTAFVAPTPGTFGNAGRNIIINAAEPVAVSPKIINVLGITEILGGGSADLRAKRLETAGERLDGAVLAVRGKALERVETRKQHPCFRGKGIEIALIHNHGKAAVVIALAESVGDRTTYLLQRCYCLLQCRFGLW